MKKIKLGLKTHVFEMTKKCPKIDGQFNHVRAILDGARQGLNPNQ